MRSSNTTATENFRDGIARVGSGGRTISCTNLARHRKRNRSIRRNGKEIAGGSSFVRRPKARSCSPGAAETVGTPAAHQGLSVPQSLATDTRLAIAGGGLAAWPFIAEAVLLPSPSVAVS